MQGIEEDKLKVQAHRGMLREEHQCEHDAHSTRSKHQQQVAGEKGLASLPLPPQQQGAQCREYPATRTGRQGEALLDHLYTARNGYATLFHQWAVETVVVDLCVVKVVHQVIGQKLLLPPPGGLVGFYSQQHIVAEACPRMLAGHLVNHVAIRRIIAFISSVFYFSADALLDDVAGLRRTVVVEVVVAVDAVGGLQVGVQRLVQTALFCARQVQHLLGDHTAKMSVFGQKILEGVGSQLVVGETEDKACYKVGLLEIEDAIVESQVLALSTMMQIVPPYGGMAIEAVYLVVRLASEQAHLYRVVVFGAVVVLCISRKGLHGSDKKP